MHNAGLNHLEHQKVRAAHAAHVSRQGEAVSGEGGAPGNLRELEARLETALRALPEACRTIFQLSRFESLKYREIADRLGLSVKTVEAQMGKALRTLRIELADFLPVLFFLFPFLNNGNL